MMSLICLGPIDTFPARIEERNESLCDTMICNIYCLSDTWYRLAPMNASGQSFSDIWKHVQWCQWYANSWLSAPAKCTPSPFSTDHLPELGSELCEREVGCSQWIFWATSGGGLGSRSSDAVLRYQTSVRLELWGNLPLAAFGMIGRHLSLDACHKWGCALTILSLLLLYSRSPHVFWKTLRQLFLYQRRHSVYVILLHAPSS